MILCNPPGRRLRQRLLVALLGVAGSCAPVKRSTAELKGATAAAASPPVFSPWDLAFLYPTQVPPADLAGMISLADLGYSPDEIRAFLDHATQRFVLAESAGLDAKPADVVNGKKALGGPLNDRLRHNAAVPTTSVVIVDAAGADQKACYSTPDRWRAVLVRVAPYKVQPPGTPAAYAAWAKAQGVALDRIIQIRVAFAPFCPSPARPDGSLAALDQALHFAFELRPADAGVAGSVFGSSGDFQNNARGQRRQPARAALLKHAQALASPPYRTFRAGVLADLAQLSARAQGLPPEAFADLNRTADALRDGTVLPADFVMPSLAHPGLTAPGGPLPAALRGFVRKYATRGNVTAIASLVTEAGSAWTHGNFGLGRYGGDASLSGEAAADYSHIHPNTMATTGAALSADKQFIDLISLRSAGFYADAFGHGFEVDDKQSAQVKALISEVDFYELPALVGADAATKTLTFAPAFPQQGAPLLAELAKYADPERTLPSSTACDACHLLPRVVAPAPGDAQITGSTNVHLLNDHAMTARTVRELDREFTKLNLEMHQRDPGGRCEPKTLRDCLSTSADAGACLDSACRAN